MPTSKTAQTVKLSQQSVNLLRQLVTALGWAKDINDIYGGGKLLSDTLKVEALDWLKSEAELAVLTPTQRAAYLKKDQQWTSKEVTLSLDESQLAIVKKAFDSFVESGAKEGRLAPNQYLNEIIDAFGYRDKAE